MPESITPEAFLANYWQKRPVLLQQTLTNVALPTLSPDELAWLATQPDVESRIVFTERTGSQEAYRVEHGPFDETYLRKLPASDWTILVHDVDKHLPELAAWFAQVPFIPKWRIDDLMVSFAAPGGSVGPHKDNYDVFLCQDVGTRHWRVSEDRSLPQDENSSDLALLRPFAEMVMYDCTQGDVLYLPPGIAHWGIAADKCMTFSIGMRAPDKLELAVCAARVLSHHLVNEPGQPEERDDEFYADPDLLSDECCGARISSRSLERLFEQDLIDRSVDLATAAIIFGSQVTDPKAWLDPDQPSDQEIRLVSTGDKALSAHGMARFAWYQDSDTGIVFVNGQARESNRVCTQFFRQLCERGTVQSAEIQELNGSQANGGFLVWLLEAGAFDLQTSDE